AAGRDEFAAIREPLVARGTTDGAVDDLGPFRSVWFTDPDGMRVEVGASSRAAALAHPFRLGPGERLRLLVRPRRRGDRVHPEVGVVAEDLAAGDLLLLHLIRALDRCA